MRREALARKIIGAPPGADMEQIRRAFRKKALRLHPDRNPGDPEAAARFVNVSNAYSTLVKGADAPLDPPSGGEEAEVMSESDYFDWWRRRWGM